MTLQYYCINYALSNQSSLHVDETNTDEDQQDGNDTPVPSADSSVTAVTNDIDTSQTNNEMEELGEAGEDLSLPKVEDTNTTEDVKDDHEPDIKSEDDGKPGDLNESPEVCLMKLINLVLECLIPSQDMVEKAPEKNEDKNEDDTQSMYMFRCTQ